MFKQIMLLSLVSALNVNAAVPMPKEIQSAFNSVHKLAGTSKVKNLFMFNYSYFAGQMCKDQDCSVENIQKQTDLAKGKMGNDFAKYSQHQSIYVNAVKKTLAGLPKQDLGTLSGERSAEQILKNKIFVTCVDFAKAILAQAIKLGFPEADLKFYVLMNTDGYKKMCPNNGDGSKPVAPRPVIHSLVAYKYEGNWYTLNVEDPEAVPELLGSELPARLSKDYQFTFPALIAYQPLKYAGAFDAKDFVNGYKFASLLGMTAAGTLETDPAKIVCQ